MQTPLHTYAEAGVLQRSKKSPMVRIPTRGGAVTLEFHSIPERDEVVDILTPLVKKVSSAVTQRCCISDLLGPSVTARSLTCLLCTLRPSCLQVADKGKAPVGQPAQAAPQQAAPQLTGPPALVALKSKLLKKDK